jgi:hypothetical protein
MRRDERTINAGNGNGTVTTGSGSTIAFGNGNDMVTAGREARFRSATAMTR